jgi:hypothetical protein
VLLGSLPVADGQWPALRRELGNSAQRLETDHFLVAFDAADDSVRALGQRLEAVYRAHVRFADELELAVRRPAHKLEVLYFAGYSTFRDYVSAPGDDTSEMLGGYLPLTARGVFFDLANYPPLAELRAQCAQAPPDSRDRLERRLEQRQATLWLSVIQHEAAHQIQFELGILPSADRVPTWLREGLATLFEIPLAPSDLATSRSNNYRLFEYRKLYASDPAKAPRLRRILTDDEAWCGGPCYPLAWALTSYFHDQRRTQFTGLLRQLGAQPGRPGTPSECRELLESLFGPLDAAWAQRFHVWTMNLPLDASDFGE